MLPEKSEIESFLIEFKQKLRTFSIVYHRSEKNSQTLLDLDINDCIRNNLLLKLSVEDYYKGPTADNYDPFSTPVWEFGLKKKGKDIYIKISLGAINKPVICKSFHIAERKIVCPYKQKSTNSKDKSE
ncbi:MAG: hypothetical protein WCA84_15335 [Ignavibacteriaceae bacterium]